MTYRTLFIANIFGAADEAFEGIFDGVKNAKGRFTDIGTDDVVVFDGGTDIDPGLYGEELHPFADLPDRARDEFERTLFRRAQAAGAACIGICRGAQFLCAVSGGKIIQDVAGHRANNHDIVTDDGRVIVAAADHHQMMFPYPVYHKLIAWAENVGTSNCEYGKDFKDEREPEIVWIPDTRSLCIQPHPEWMAHDNQFPKYCRELVEKYIFNAN